MIDWTRVDELVQEIGAEDFCEVADLSIEEVDDAINRLDACQGNPALTEEHMHFLKGAALNLGFATLARLCLKGEKAAAAGEPEAVAAGEVRTTFAESCRQFRRELPARLAA